MAIPPTEPESENKVNIIIFGLPKTGTTGLFRTLRLSIESAGWDCVSVFEPRGPKPWKAFSKRARPELWLLSKAMLKPRYFADGAVSIFDKKIMIVRDPRDRLISAFLFKGLSRPKHAAGHIDELIKLLEEKERDPSAIPFLELNDRLDEIQLGSLNIDTVISELEYQLDCIEALGFHICYYEDFVAEEFSALQSYLGFDLISQNPSQTAWLKHIERSKGSGEWRQWLTEADIEHLKPKLGPVMERLGYKDDWNLPATPRIDPQQSSDHVRRNFESRRQQMESASNRGDIAETPEELELIELRADDGRVDDILRAVEAMSPARAGWNQT